MRIFTQSAFAKINLGLKVISKRPNGYHDILTHFQRISLMDILAVFPKTAGVAYTGPRLTENPRNNLSVKAAEKFIEVFGIDSGVEIALTKRIPTGAGLGGGSSDAAAVLNMLSRFFSIDIHDEKLEKLALELGADVPFFLSGLRSAYGSGLGEQLQSVEGIPDNRYILILWPGFQISTAQAYQEIDNSLTDASRNAKLWVRSISESLRSDDGHFLNDFETIAFSSHPVLLQARNDLLQASAETAGLSGSGSSIFAIFDGEISARRAASTWRAPWQSFLCRPC